jgi:paraquat-inducible protein B
MADPDGPPLRMRMRFDSPLRGLVLGAPVEFYGVSIGNVVKVAVDFDPPTQKFSLLVDVVTYPHRLGSVLAKFPTNNEEDAKVAASSARWCVPACVPRRARGIFSPDSCTLRWTS